MTILEKSLCPPTVPGAGLHPVDSIEERCCASITGICSVYALHVCVARVLKQLHYNRLDRLRLINDSLGADLQSSNAVVGQVVSLY